MRVEIPPSEFFTFFFRNVQDSFAPHVKAELQVTLETEPGAARHLNPLLSLPCSLISSVMPSQGQKPQKLVLGETSAIGSVKVRVDFVPSEGLSKLQLRGTMRQQRLTETQAVQTKLPH